MPNFKIGSTSFGFYFQFLRALSKFDAKTSCAATPGGGDCLKSKSTPSED